MNEAINELNKLREYYRMHGKTLQAHVIKTAIEKLRKYAREQKAKEEVQTPQPTGGPGGVCCGSSAASIPECQPGP